MGGSQNLLPVVVDSSFAGVVILRSVKHMLQEAFPLLIC